MARAGMRFGQWRVVRRLGGGGMGEVFLASGPRNQIAALKVVRAELADDPSFRVRFRREIDASSRIRGAFVAEVLDANATADRPWIATEYLTGPTLAMHVEQRGALAEHAIRALAVALADALSSIWQAGVVHRDLKPSNVILAERGPVLIDFGIAAASDVTALTAPGMALGSAGWMAPEQLRGTVGSSPSQDVWGWGALIAYASSGSGPFGRGPADALRWRALNGPVEHAVISAVPALLRSLVALALEAEPRGRPDAWDLPRLARDAAFGSGSARATASMDVTRLWQQDNTLLAPPHRLPSTWRRSRKFWAVISAAAVACTAILVIGVRNWPNDRVGTIPEEDTPSSSVTSTSSSTSTVEPSSTATTTSSMTTELPGLDADLIGVTDTDPTHWRPSDAESDQALSTRVFDAGWVHVADFPVTMNGCDTRQLRVAWRSISRPVRAGVSYYRDSWDETPIVPDQVGAAAQSGTLLLNGCEQPAFSAVPGDGISDIAVEVSVHSPAVGAA